MHSSHVPQLITTIRCIDGAAKTSTSKQVIRMSYRNWQLSSQGSSVQLVSQLQPGIHHVWLKSIRMALCLASHLPIINLGACKAYIQANDCLCRPLIKQEDPNMIQWPVCRRTKYNCKTGTQCYTMNFIYQVLCTALPDKQWEECSWTTL